MYSLNSECVGVLTSVCRSFTVSDLSNLRGARGNEV